ncbi:MAG: hypothetical protein NTW28_13890 [Candidatus Solibacter sp.]|nr:hypothetical protein [Candidatus Solibacter sp.]
MASTSDSTVFVLGAGFSVAEGFPLIRGLRDRVVHFLEAERNSAYTAWLEPCGEFPEGQFYAGLRTIDQTSSLEFEELLITLSKRRQENRRGDPCFQTDVALRIGCARLLWCLQNAIWQVSECYRNFAGWLRSDGSDAIVCFNWDLLVEKMLVDAGHSWAYAGAGPGIPVLKPHGSINWSGHLRERLSAPYPHWQPLGPGSSLCFDRREPLSNPNKQEVNSDLRYMIFPGDPDLPGRDTDVRWLWEQAERAISDRDSLVFIGYSLPDYDRFAADFFRRFAGRKSLAAYTPSAEHLIRYREVFGPSAVLRQERFDECVYATSPPP